MPRLVITEPADADYDQIMLDLGSKAGPNVVDYYDRSFDNIFQRLLTFPESGSARPALGPRTRVCVLSPFVVIYEYVNDEDVVVIMGVVHGRRRITRKLLWRQS